jgi:hypothetical protein
VARQADDAHVEGEVFAAELRADADLAGDLQQFLFEFEVAEGLAVLVALGGQRVVVFGGRELDGLEAVFRGGAADDKREVVGRAGGGAERFHFLHAELLEPLRIQQGLGFLIEKGLVGRAAALADEEELVGVAFGGVEVDLRGQVGAWC